MPSTLPKFQVWERKLLDFTLRNNLLNARVGKRALPLLSADMAALEDALQSGDNFSFVAVEGEAAGCFSFAEELAARHLGIPVGSVELKPSLTHIYRTSRNAIEENGANSLFVALGMLQWFEANKSTTPRKAPLLLLPVEMVRHGAGYVIRSRDEEIILNITLLEFLRQEYHITIPLSNPLPVDEHGVDVAQIMQVIKEAISVQPQWAVLDECLLGLFSFSKFVMWNDIHLHSDLLASSPVVQSLVQQRLTFAPDSAPLDVKAFDRTAQPSEVAVPISADASQLEAVVEAGKGQSFILFGPPGTGKSQTITNIIANALYQGKRVLFVAEKMAALSVVQRRLQKIGLNPFCLELHSNKVTKKHVLEQLQQAIEVAHGRASEDLQQRSAELFEVRRQLNAYMDALHAPSSYGLSLYECIEKSLLVGDAPMLPGVEDVAVKLNVSQLEEALSLLRELDSVFQTTGPLTGHPLTGLRITHDGREQLTALSHRLTLFKDVPVEHRPSALGARWEQVQAKWFLPRFFARRSFLKLLRQFDPTLQQEQIPTFLTQTAFVGDGSSIQAWMEHRSEWRDWYQWDSRRQALLDMGLDAVVTYLESGNTPEATALALQRALYGEWALDIIDRNEGLRHFNGLLFDEVIARFQHLQAHYQELTKTELYCRLAARIPNMLVETATGSEANILKRNIANGGRGTSIRHLLEQIPHLLPRLCPCMLMSPISVAQFIGPEQPKFDLVIFDEASQMPTSEAVGAIGRGEALIVVGDNKQMPPTSFFNSSNLDEEEADLDDLDSILDDCQALSMPNHYLSFHYRSRHESLIAFSNREYYENRLFTFPSADDRAHKVKLIPVNGVYDKGGKRQNREEAQAVVAEVMLRLADPKRCFQSIGIVAFSVVQQNLIEDLLSEALATQPELEKLALGGEEPIFVKNLENVQGDERDVIFFSIGYGPDKNGAVSMNFGPLNNAGGERRLNVAVSRARIEMLVFTSLRPEDIDPRRSQAEGVMGLRRFLQFAQGGGDAIASSFSGASPSSSVPDAVAEDIASALREQGYEATTQVGRSAFKVDVAISDPTSPDRYLLAILLDGHQRAATALAYDRDVSQPGVLKGLGWKVLRVWSMEWLQHRQRTLDAILAAIRQPQETATKTSEPPLPTPQIVKVASKPRTAPVAAATNAPRKVEEMSIQKVDKVVQQIVADQVALPMEALLRAAARELGFTRRGARIDAAVEQSVQRLARSGLLVQEGEQISFKA